MNAMSRQIDVIKSVSTLMDHTHVLAELGTGFYQMGTIAQVTYSSLSDSRIIL